MVSNGETLQVAKDVSVYLGSGVARTQPMPGHTDSVGTLHLRIASYPGPTQL